MRAPRVWPIPLGVGCFPRARGRALAAAALSRNPARGWRFSRAMAKAFLRLCRLPLTVHGLEHIPASGSFVIAVNHASYLDGLILLAAARAQLQLRRQARVEPIAHRAVVPAHRHRLRRPQRHQARRGGCSRLAESVRAGRSPIFFAEGTFIPSAGLLPFRMGAFVVAAQTDVPLVPVAIRGARSVLRDGSWFARRGTVAITISAPLLPQGSDSNAAVALRDAARADILRHCGEPDLAPRA